MTFSSWSTRSAGWANATPRSASVTTSAGSLISFFTGAPVLGGDRCVSYAAVTTADSHDRAGHDRGRLGIGLAALGRPAYITAGRGADLAGGRTVADLRDRTFAVLDAAHPAGGRSVAAPPAYGRGGGVLAAGAAGGPGG